ncbi:MAG: PD40 domain-containing protein, partial [Armatimonadetes bacterium]|nr:PD40 domain-containing protein [Armatimonadota bacterium]
MWRWDRLAALVVVGLLAPLAPVAADFPDGFNHPEVSWLELETDHFLLIYGEGLEPTARLSADLLEAAHERLTAELDVVPGAKTTVVLTDFDDVGFNNFARRMQHVIYISNPILNQARVEREQWLAHLLPHEYIHVLNGWALRRAGRAVGPLTEWAGMELQPQWFTEGLAEYFAGHGERREGQFILQAAQQNQLLYGGKLDIADLRFDVIETSVVYKQGESMCLYLAEKYGEDIFKRILGLYGKAPQFDIAFRVATGQLVEEFYRDWLQRIQARAAARPADDPVLASTTAYPTPLEAALGARVSPDGKLIAVYGVKDWEEPIPGLYLMNADGSHFHRIAGNLDLYDSWKFSWSADSRYLLYTGRIRGGSGAVLNGIFVYDTVKEKSWKVDSKAQRVGEPELSPDGKLILFTTYLNERTITATMTTDGANVRYLTADIPGNAFSPTWSPDGQSVAFSLADANGTDLAVIGRDGSGLRRLTNDPWPDQYPDWSPDGQTIAFVSFRQPGEERTDAAVSAEAQGLAVAATNLYTIPAAGGELTQLTEATSGGAYYPSWTPDGSGLAFSLFQIRNATVRRLEIAAARRAAAERPA